MSCKGINAPISILLPHKAALLARTWGS